MKICGPKCSLCGLIISAWGVIQLGYLRANYSFEVWTAYLVLFVLVHTLHVLMGIFYHVRSVALAEDIPIKPEEENDVNEFYTAVERGYTQNAINCWIAACLYILTFIFSGHQFYVNSRSSLTM